MTILKEIKQEFLAFRNGIVADTLRKAGLPFKVIFGLQLPQLRMIATNLTKRIADPQQRKVLAETLIADVNVRESRILGYALMPAELLSEPDALSLCDGILSREEADLLPFLLLRYTPYLNFIIEKGNFEGDFSKHLLSNLKRYSE